MAVRRFPLWPYLAGLVLVALVTVFGLLIHGLIAPTNLVMLFLLVVVIVALRWGLGPAIFTALAGVLAFDFFLVPPRHNLGVSDTQYLLTFLGLLITGVVISALGGTRTAAGGRSGGAGAPAGAGAGGGGAAGDRKAAERAAQLDLPRPADAPGVDHRAR